MMREIDCNMLRALVERAGIATVLQTCLQATR
jgi:hypothetical protein